MTSRDTPEFLAQKVILDITEQICDILDQCRISRTGLAQKLGVTPAMVTHLLRGESNVTVATLTSIAHAVGRSLKIQFAAQPCDQPWTNEPTPTEVSANCAHLAHQGWRFATSRDMQSTGCNEPETSHNATLPPP